MLKGSSLNRICTIDGCDKKHKAKGLCGMHWQRWDKYRTFDLIKIKQIKLENRFYSNFTQALKNECWVWTGYTHKQGYGRISVNKKMVLAHRVAWEIYNGPIPKGMSVCHKCDNPKCVNPEHLFIGTHKDNMHDCIKKGRFVYVKRR